MTDNEIIKALECCCKGGFVCGENCPRFENGTFTIPACRFELLGNALDLINRQKAEIERLKRRNDELNVLNSMVAQEAIKEFAERLKARATGMLLMGERFSTVDTDDIDNLVTELTESE